MTDRPCIHSVRGVYPRKRIKSRARVTVVTERWPTCAQARVPRSPWRDNARRLCRCSPKNSSIFRWLPPVLHTRQCDMTLLDNVRWGWGPSPHSWVLVRFCKTAVSYAVNKCTYADKNNADFQPTVTATRCYVLLHTKHTKNTKIQKTQKIRSATLSMPYTAMIGQETKEQWSANVPEI